MLVLYLAIGLSNIIVIFNPNEIVLAGGVIEKQAHLLEKAIVYLNSIEKVYKYLKLELVVLETILDYMELSHY